MIDSLLMKLRRRDDVSPAEEEALRKIISCVETVPAKQTLIRRGEPLNRPLCSVNLLHRL